ncbi:DUF2787 domain-containing protein [Shewanella sp. Isolate11]|uniref:DUF2787 domain-containing protein n=1 Tax=Shewanella sp. Isolate11 TaxID=2908530 RepID=UPI001EFD03E9|nr:DUF2787 domain-containing protein [Shewanella sp. Isolate11]MCG9698023.1 DUF2787 domain-containing protein [Shewanella sp. Isolate11]
MNIHRETTIQLPEPFYELLERQLAAINIQEFNIVTFNFHDPDYSAEEGGYHPVEINLYRHGDSWQLNYFTDFAYCGGPFPELEKEMDVQFRQQEVYNSFFGRCYLSHADHLIRQFIENFCSYVDMEVYRVQVSVD